MTENEEPEIVHIEEDDPDDGFFMANIGPDRTGLPFVVWIINRGFSKHDVRVKASPSFQMIPEQMVSVAIRPEIKVVRGQMGSELTLLKSWIETNRQVLLDYWDGELPTSEALKRLKKI